MAPPLLNCPVEIKDLISKDLGANDVLNMRLACRDLRAYVDVKINREKLAERAMKQQCVRLAREIERNKHAGRYLENFTNWLTTFHATSIPERRILLQAGMFVVMYFSISFCNPTFLNTDLLGWVRFTKLLLEAQLEYKAFVKSRVPRSPRAGVMYGLTTFQARLTARRPAQPIINVADLTQMAGVYLKILIGAEEGATRKPVSDYLSKMMITGYELPAMDVRQSSPRAWCSLDGVSSRKEIEEVFEVPSVVGQEALAYCSDKAWVIPAIQRSMRALGTGAEQPDPLIKAAIVEKMYIS